MPSSKEMLPLLFVTIVLKDDDKAVEILHLPRTLVKSSSTTMSEPEWRKSLAWLISAVVAAFAARPIGGRSLVSSKDRAN